MLGVTMSNHRANLWIGPGEAWARRRGRPV